ncbi:PadR family transcriptional regulator [Actinosynnema sp. NPDC059797]
MSVKHALLGLLESQARYGYELKHSYDEHFTQGKPLHYGQVYSTLARLLRGGLVEESGVEAGAGPDRKRYAITEAGVTDLMNWLTKPEEPSGYLQNTLYVKVVVALLSGRESTEVLDAQRTAHIHAMRELTKRKNEGDLVDALICDHALFHLEADLRWLEITSSRLGELAERVRAS